MNHIDKVREGLEGALELRANVAESLMSTYANQPSARSAELEAVAIEEGIRAALSALSAHEQEVVALVEALRKLERFVTNSDDDFGLEQDWTEECRDVVMGARAILTELKP